MLKNIRYSVLFVCVIALAVAFSGEVNAQSKGKGKPFGSTQAAPTGNHKIKQLSVKVVGKDYGFKSAIVAAVATEKDTKNYSQFDLCNGTQAVTVELKIIEEPIVSRSFAGKEAIAVRTEVATLYKFKAKLFSWDASTNRTRQFGEIEGELGKALNETVAKSVAETIVKNALKAVDD